MIHNDTALTLANLANAQPVLAALVDVGARIINVSADPDKVLVLAFDWHPMYDDEVKVCHAAGTSTLVEATAKIVGTNVHRTWNLGLVDVITVEPLPVEAAILVQDCESFA